MPNSLAVCLHAAMRQIFLGLMWSKNSIKYEFGFVSIALLTI
jgi:hypothetical protein